MLDISYNIGSFNQWVLVRYILGKSLMAMLYNYYMNVQLATYINTDNNYLAMAMVKS